MALIINDDCIACGACLPECPHGAITEGESRYDIDRRLCDECAGDFDSPRCQAVCPVDAPQKAPAPAKGHKGNKGAKKQPSG
jgi:ferredoxin